MTPIRLWRFELRPGPLRLEGRRRRQAGAHAVVPAQRHGGAAADLEGGHRRCADRRPIPCVSDDVKAKAKTAAADAPYQWVLRRMFLGRFLDSDKVYYPESGGFRLVELAPNVQQVVGGSANNLIVAMKDGHRDLRRAGRRRAVALGHRRGQGQVSGQADQAAGADPPPHGPLRRHPRLRGGRRRDRHPGPGAAVLREDVPGRAQARAGCAGEAAEAGEDRGREGHDVAQGRDDRGHAATTSRTRMPTA